MHTKAPNRLNVIQFEDLVPVPLRHILVYIADGSTFVEWLSACKAHIVNLRQQQGSVVNDAGASLLKWPSSVGFSKLTLKRDGTLLLARRISNSKHARIHQALQVPGAAHPGADAEPQGTARARCCWRTVINE